MRHPPHTVAVNLVAVDPSTNNLTVCGFSGNPLDIPPPKKSLKIQPTGSQVFGPDAIFAQGNRKRHSDGKKPSWETTKRVFTN